MRINSIEGLILPNKKDEEFLKINFDPLFSYDFKEHKSYEIDIMGLKTIEDTSSYESLLFDITRSVDKTQKILRINKNIPEPIFIIHKIKEDETFFTNSLKIELSADIKAQVVEVFVSSCKNSAYSVNRTFELEENSELEYVRIQDFDASNSLIFNALIKQEESSNVDFTNFEYGDGFILNNFINNINNKNITYNLNGLVKLNNDASCSNLIKTVHIAQSSLSNINYKHSLKDSSKAIFKAKSRVLETALFSKAFQNTDTILLSDDATIFAQPHLEIYIDELEASHGATTGTLNKEQLLYLQTRGIPKDLAYEMLLKAFEEKIVNNIKDEIIKEFVQEYKKEQYV
ncbi:MAG: SufD family Fe-S cluster assembly protein [Aliarcobacter sp.]|nr:SufD family Fe-S cluster assembly protein [Aliarcobacter sp.]